MAGEAAVGECLLDDDEDALLRSETTTGRGAHRQIRGDHNAIRGLQRAFRRTQTQVAAHLLSGPLKHRAGALVEQIEGGLDAREQRRACALDSDGFYERLDLRRREVKVRRHWKESNGIGRNSKASDGF